MKDEWLGDVLLKMHKKFTKADFIPFSFILIQSVLELAIYISHVAALISSKTKIIKIISISWVVEYFYIFVAYLSASFMNPGYLPPTWISEVQKDPDFKDEPAENGEKNFCEYCCFPRPLRCHHCKECGKCVLLYDHHCFFLSNCVGFRNFKCFFLFLCVFPVHAVTTVFLMIYSVAESKDPTALQMVSLMLGLFYFFLFGIFVVAQLTSQIGFLVHNKTWVEETLRGQQKKLYEKAGVPQENTYDVGLIQNLKCRLGNNPLLWLLPIPNFDNPYKYKINPKWVPVYKLKVSFIEGLDEGSPLLARYTRKRGATNE